LPPAWPSLQTLKEIVDSCRSFEFIALLIESVDKIPEEEYEEDDKTTTNKLLERIEGKFVKF